MIKKLLVAAVVGGLAVAAAKGTKIGRYVWHEVQTAVRQAEEDIPLEKQVAMLEQEHQRLKTVALPKKIHEVAEARVEFKDLDKQLAVIEERQKETQRVLAGRLDALKKGAGQVAADPAAAEAQAALEKDAAAWRAGEKSLADRKKTRDQAKKNVDALEDELRALVTEIDQIGVEVQELKVQLREARARQLRDRQPAGNGEVAAVRARLNEAKKKFQVEAEAGEVARAHGLAPAAKPAVPPVPTKTLAELEAEIKGAAAAPPALPKSGD